MIRSYLSKIIYILVFLAIPFLAFGQEGLPKNDKLIIFYSSTCHECIKLNKEFMPEIEKRFKDRIKIDYRDIGALENYKLLLALKEEYGIKVTKLPTAFFARRFLSGEAQIKRQLIQTIENSLGRFAIKEVMPDQIDLVSYFKSFNPWVVISAGLVDGINPCAFTVIVFFISFLSLQGYGKKEVSIIGLSFISAVFLTYLLIGLGLFEFLYRLKNFWKVAKIFNFSIGLFSILLGFFALYDFFKFKKSKTTEGLVLQLPPAIKNKIHAIIGLHYRKTKDIGGQKYILRLVISALVTGFLVSILEAVCTGQVYLPTITFVLKLSSLKLQALAYLLLYNLMFILPLLVIFFFGLLGVNSEQFSKFLKRHLLTVKLLMAGLFFGLGIFLLR